jgi:hypothetical protein
MSIFTLQPTRSGKPYSTCEVDVNSRDFLGRTALHIICRVSSFDQTSVRQNPQEERATDVQMKILKALLEIEQTDIFAKDCDKHFAAEYALRHTNRTHSWDMIEVFKKCSRYDRDSDLGRIIEVRRAPVRVWHDFQSKDRPTPVSQHTPPPRQASGNDEFSI